MAEATTTETTKKPGKGGPKEQPKAPARSRRTIKALGRAKRVARLKTDKEFAKTYFEAKSKRSTDKKSAFRKKKKGKKA